MEALSWGVAAAYAAGREGRRRRHGANPVRVSCPLVSVGSVQAGGAGKTPLAIAVANLLASGGRQVGVALLGSGGRAGWRPRLYAPGSNLDPEVVGDEAALVAKAAPKAALAVGRDRTAGAEALAAGGVDAVVVEDGMQWCSLARDLNLVAVGPGRGPATPLPRGRLREWPSAYGRADAIIALPGADMGVLSRWAGGVPVLAWEAGTPGWSRLDGAPSGPPPAGLPLCAGLADPSSLAAELVAEGLAPLVEPFADHASGRAARERMLRLARAHGGVLLTPKDAARWGPWLAGIPVWVRQRALSLPAAARELVEGAV